MGFSLLAGDGAVRFAKTLHAVAETGAWLMELAFVILSGMALRKSEPMYACYSMLCAIYFHLMRRLR